MAIGHKTGGGSRKGRPNKINADLKAMILGALDQAGGQQYLAEQARANPAAFMTLLGKVLPRQVGGVPDEPIGISMSLEEQRAEARREIDEAFAEYPREEEPSLGPSTLSAAADHHRVAPAMPPSLPVSQPRYSAPRRYGWTG